MLPNYLRKAATIVFIFQTVFLLLWYLKYNATLTVLMKRNISNIGTISVNINAIEWMDIEKKFQKVIKGSYQPENCKARHKVAILVPYRDRDTHLRIFINHMHSFLIRQQLEYGIYIVELDKDIPFNRGFLFNVGVMEALKDNNYGCFVFHDVDLLPLNDLNLYQCPDQPKHLSVAIDKYKFKLLYATNFGGVSSMSTEQFTTINGYSNLFFGWGGEDDDFYNRVVSNNMTISRDNSSIARYTMLPHKKAPINPFRMDVLNSGTKRPNQAVDGLNSLQYNLTEKVYRKMYVHITVTLNKKDAVTQLLNRLKKGKSQISESQIFETFKKFLKN
uniref:Beta-1,4-galactosyltransferase n=1 Tax=Crassostrea virginica TaxID=6565 RepID=A0A8B8CFZ3_CRAVI|nr:beta-1,4-galactosyltransferase 4-like isoform X2 [Crassostrea virginica]